MAIWNRESNSVRRARNDMDEAAKYGRSEESFEEKLKLKTGDEKFAKTYRTRGKLYDKINVSLRTMDIIIYAVAALLVIALVVGIVIGN